MINQNNGSTRLPFQQLIFFPEMLRLTEPIQMELPELIVNGKQPLPKYP